MALEIAKCGYYRKEQVTSQSCVSELIVNLIIDRVVTRIVPSDIHNT